jgi:hypothetical protein
VGLCQFGTELWLLTSKKGVRQLAPIAVASLCLAGCGGTDWSGAWTDSQGRELPPTVIWSLTDDACYPEGVVFISIGDPKSGTFEFGPGKARTYVRNPGALAKHAVAALFDGEAHLPKDARFSGYRLGDVEVWLSGRGTNAIYVRTRDSVERWPWVVNIPRCA